MLKYIILFRVIIFDMLIVTETLSTFTIKEANVNTTPAYSSKKVRFCNVNQ